MPDALTAAPEGEARLVLDLPDIGHFMAAEAVWPLHPGRLSPCAEAALL